VSLFLRAAEDDYRYRFVHYSYVGVGVGRGKRAVLSSQAVQLAGLRPGLILFEIGRDNVMGKGYDECIDMLRVRLHARIASFQV
jgi:hypothetical protein